MSVVMVSNTNNSVFGLVKGQSYNATRIFWYNGEHQVRLDDGREIPLILLDDGPGVTDEDLDAITESQCL